jgi:putative CocE/NonD family hydrolase
MGTRTPQAEVGGLKFGPASLVDMGKLHLQWYNWIMESGAQPEFLQAPVSYYVMGKDRWRYAASLESVTAAYRQYSIDSQSNATSPFRSGSLTLEPAAGQPDHIIHDPRDVSMAKLELTTAESGPLVDQRMVNAREGREFVYQSTAFEQDTEVSGFFKLSAWIAIDQPDIDLNASIYEIGLDGGSILLTGDMLRARYRQSLRRTELIHTKRPLEYKFERFNFISRQIKKGSRLRLVITPINSIYVEKNYSSGGVVAEETVSAARPVQVKLYHEATFPSVLYLPLGRPE